MDMNDADLAVVKLSMLLDNFIDKGHDEFVTPP